MKITNRTNSGSGSLSSRFLLSHSRSRIIDHRSVYSVSVFTSRSFSSSIFMAWSGCWRESESWSYSWDGNK